MVGLLLARLMLDAALALGQPAASGAGLPGRPPEPAAGRLAQAAEPAAGRLAMVRGIEAEARATAARTGIEAIDPRVLEAMRTVPREAFVPASLQALALGPGPVPVHPEQNLAAPFLTALMLHLAGIRPGASVLETGTDTGYQAAVLARLGARVVSVEILPELVGVARRLLAEHAPGAVEVAQGDGYDGWPERAPFDAIIVKEAVDHVPPPLLAQLAPGGRLVLPLGPAGAVQELTLVVRRGDGGLDMRRVLPVRFAPFQRGSRT